MKRLSAMWLVLATACSRTDAPHVIDGVGATLPFPLYSKWATEFARVDKTVRVNYQPLGSGAGIRQMADGVVDFGATDEPMTDDQLKADFVHVPMTVGGVAIVVHLPGVSELRLTPELLADVFLGVVTRWDDPKLLGPNASVVLPSEPITVVHRADGSGTSATLTTYLARTSERWRKDIGTGLAPRFPVGVGARGNDGVTAYVKATPHTFGYVELAYARQAGLTTVALQNRAGRFVTPSLASIDRAARAAAKVIPNDLRLSMVDAADPEAYPIAAISYVIVRRDGRDHARSAALAKFLWWGLHEGQELAPALDYAPLPPAIVARAELVVKELRAEGRPALLSSRGP